jgi:hypothetical protein
MLYRVQVNPEDCEVARAVLATVMDLERVETTSQSLELR